MTFYFLDLNFAMLISLMVGLSVLVPYIGATVVAFPVVLMGFFQFGWSPDFMWVAVSYAIIQLLDGNLLAPLLLSEVVNLHPVAIITPFLYSADCGASGASFLPSPWPPWCRRSCGPGFTRPAK